MSSQIVNPFEFLTDRKGDALDEGYVYIGVANQDPESFPQACFFDEALTIPATQPLRTIAGYIVNGSTPSDVYTATGYYSIRIRTSQGIQVFYEPVQTDAVGKLAAPTGSSHIGFIQGGADAVARTALSKMRETVTPEDFGAIGDGVTDDTEALRDALVYCAGKTLVLKGSYLITGTLNPPSNCTIRGDQGAEIVTATPDMSMFFVQLKENVVFEYVKFRQTYAEDLTYVAAITLDRSHHCTVDHCEFEGIQWSGVYLASSNYNTVSNNYFHDFAGTTIEGADIHIYYSSSDNLVFGNRCYGGALVYVGINIQAPGSNPDNDLPARNKIIGNYIGTHSQYGINVYIGGNVVNSWNLVEGNYVEDITSSSFNAAGTGIYGVGNGIGGLIIRGNQVKNCCQQTTDRTNGPGGIAVSGVAAGSVKPIVTGNTIDAMAQGDGILIATGTGGCIVTGNVIRMPSTNNGTGPGGATLLGSGIRSDNGSNVVIEGNDVIVNGTGAGILSFATAADQTNVKINGNGVKTAANNGIRVIRSSSFVHKNSVVSGNTVECGGAFKCLEIASVQNSTISGNALTTGADVAISMSASTRVTLSGNVLTGTGSYGAAFSGTCTGSVYDKSNSHSGVLSNGATGMLVEFYSAASPATGDYRVGDMAFNSAPVAAGTPGWVCTASGTPGTWKARANVAA